MSGARRWEGGKLENAVWLKHKPCEGGRVLFWRDLTSCLDKRTLTGDVLISNVKTAPGEFACNYKLSQNSRQPRLHSGIHFFAGCSLSGIQRAAPCAAARIKLVIRDGAAAGIRTTPPSGICYTHGENIKVSEIQRERGNKKRSAYRVRGKDEDIL